MLRNYELSWDAYPKAAPMSNYPSTDYFCIHVLVTPAQVSLVTLHQQQGYPLPDISAIEYSFNKSEWFTYTGPITVDDHVYFRGSPVLFVTPSQPSVPSWNNFNGARGFVVNVPFYVSGKISSLVDKYLTGEVENPRYGFNELFAGASARQYLINAEYLQLDYDDTYCLPSGDYHYHSTNGMYSCMFLGCENLVKGPQIKATKMRSGTCYQMFDSCSKLTVAPDLMASVISGNCYEMMFRNCISLTTPAKMPNTITYFESFSTHKYEQILDNFHLMYQITPKLQYTPRFPLIDCTPILPFPTISG